MDRDHEAPAVAMELLRFLDTDGLTEFETLQEDPEASETPARNQETGVEAD